MINELASLIVESASAIYSFRYEAACDFTSLCELLYRNAEFQHIRLEFANDGVELTTELSFPQMQARIATISDGHVMAETLRPVPLAENSLDRRDYDEDLLRPETPEDVVRRNDKWAKWRLDSGQKSVTNTAELVAYAKAALVKYDGVEKRKLRRLQNAVDDAEQQAAKAVQELARIAGGDGKTETKEF